MQRSVAVPVLALVALSGCGDDAATGPRDAPCTLDCAGVCNGPATIDRCGVCDSDPTNDCWKGSHGLTALPEIPMFANLGTGMIGYSVRDAAVQQAYFYSGDGPPHPLVEIAQTTPMNACNTTETYRGYDGLASIHELTDATTLTYDGTAGGVVFGTESSSCYRGLLVFRQSGLYGVLRFIAIKTDGSVDIEYWIGQQGVTDFRNAP